MWAVPRDALGSFPTGKIELSRFSIVPAMTCRARMEIQTGVCFGEPKGCRLCALGHHCAVMGLVPAADLSQSTEMQPQERSDPPAKP